MNKNANVQEYEVGINANFGRMWKSRMFAWHDISFPPVTDIIAFASTQCD